MVDVKTITNGRERPLISGFELTAEERAEFDYIDPAEFDSHDFFRYRGAVYDPGEFMAAPASLAPWQGIAADSYFSGTLIRFAPDGEGVFVGRYYS